MSNASTELCRLVAAGELDAAVLVEPQFALPKPRAWMPLMDEPLVVVAPLADLHRDAHELLRSEPFIRYDRSVWGGQSPRVALTAEFLKHAGAMFNLPG